MTYLDDDDETVDCPSCKESINIEKDDDIAECSIHGWYHDACRGDACDCRPEPEFDKDAYYDRKYGYAE